MPEFDVDPEMIYVFDLGEEYVFRHYFERRDIFDELKDYYNNAEYRFEIPEDEFTEVREFLYDNYYDLFIVTDLEPYCVVKEQYTPHADILRQCVLHWTRRGHNFFLMKDELAVEHALEEGATRLVDTEFVLGI